MMLTIRPFCLLYQEKPIERYAVVARPGCIFRLPSQGLGWSFHGWPRLRCQRGGLCWRFSGGDGQNLPTGYAHRPPAPLFGHLHKFVPENGGFVLWRLHPSLASQLLHHLWGSQSPPAFGLPGYLLVSPTQFNSVAFYYSQGSLLVVCFQNKQSYFRSVVFNIMRLVKDKLEDLNVSLGHILYEWCL